MFNVLIVTASQPPSDKNHLIRHREYQLLQSAWFPFSDRDLKLIYVIKFIGLNYISSYCLKLCSPILSNVNLYPSPHHQNSLILNTSAFTDYPSYTGKLPCYIYYGLQHNSTTNCQVEGSRAELTNDFDMLQNGQILEHNTLVISSVKLKLCL